MIKKQTELQGEDRKRLKAIADAFEKIQAPPGNPRYARDAVADAAFLRKLARAWVER